MKTTLKIQLLDSSEDGCVCFEDIMIIPNKTPEELFTAIFGSEDIDVPPDDIRTGLDETNNPLIEMDFYQDKCYKVEYYTGLKICNKIASILGNTERTLASTQYGNNEHEITDEEAESIMNGEMINAGTNAPMQRIFEHDDTEDDDKGLMDEKKWLQHTQKLNNDAREVLGKLYDLIVHLKDMDTYYYIYHMLIDESIGIENDLSEKFKI